MNLSEAQDLLERVEQMEHDLRNLHQAVITLIELYKIDLIGDT